MVLVALFWIAVAVLLAIALLHTRTTLQWIAAAIFLALALDPAVSLIQGVWPGESQMPRVFAILIVYLVALAGLVFLTLHVFPPIVHDIENLAHNLPGYVHDFEDWANNNKQFQELNQKYDITQKLTEEASTLPSHLSSGASTIGSLTVSLLEHLLAAITVIALSFFLLLDGRGMVERGTGRLPTIQRDRARAKRRPGRRGRQGLRQRQPAARDRRRLPHLGVPGSRGLPPGRAPRRARCLPRPHPSGRPHGRGFRSLRGAADRRRARRRDHLVVIDELVFSDSAGAARAQPEPSE